MSSIGDNPAAPGVELGRRGLRLGDVLFKGVSLVAAAAATFLLVLIAWKVFDLAWPAIQHFGLAFIWESTWDPARDVYGALVFIYGTLVTALIALLLATPLSIAIALFLLSLIHI